MKAHRPKVRSVLALALVGTLASSSLAVVVAAQDHDEASADSSDAQAHAEERNEGGDSKVKVFRFSGFDINGRLKSPSLLYFLNRLRAEFDHPRLPHRSFMPELESETAQSKALKE